MRSATSHVRFTPESDIKRAFSIVRLGPEADTALLSLLEPL
jgi:hypothetical protein